MNRILVTGCPGWLGNVLVAKLAATSSGIRLLVSPAIERKAAEKALPAGTQAGIELVQVDLRDTGRLPEAVRGVDIVYHLAAVQHPSRVSEMYAVNARATGALARAAADADVEKFVFVSSSTVHGANPTDEPLTESSPMIGLTHYALSKIGGERLLADVSTSSGLHAVVVRPGVFYGLNPSANMQRVIDWLKNKPGPVFGNNGQYRTYADVEKVADAIVAAATCGGKGQAYLIGDREQLSTRQFYEALGEGLDCPIRIITLPVAAARLAERLTFLAGRLLDLHVKLGNIAGEFGRSTYFRSERSDELGVQMHESPRPGLREMAQRYRGSS